MKNIWNKKNKNLKKNRWITFNKDIFYAKAKLIDIDVWEELTVLLNEHQARVHGISAVDKVAVLYDDGSEFVVSVDLTKDLVKAWYIGILRDVAKKYWIQEGEHLWVYFTKRSNVAVEAIKKRLVWHKLTDSDIYAIIKDISDNKLSDTLISYYAASNFVRKADNHELYITAKAMAESGDMIKFDGIVADKHCIWWVPGNETTMIVVPTIASLGIKIPKVFSKAITSPAATGECVEVLMNHTFDIKEIQSIVKKENCSLVRWGGLSLAAADDKIIKVSYPLSMQSYGKMISSIMAKQYAMWINHCLIDIPVWPTAKVTDMKTAQHLKRQFTYVWKHLGMKMSVVITPAKEPIWKWIWAVLQVREVLRVLQQHKERPEDLEKKAMFLASKIVEMVGLAKWKKALDMCYTQLRSGKSWKKMQSIIKTQSFKDKKSKYFDGLAWNVKSEDLILWRLKHKIFADKEWIVKSIDMKYLNIISRTLWTPLSAQSGVFLDKKLWNHVQEWACLYTLYANDQHKLDMAIKMLDKKKIYTY